jgi:tetratricopeptide (TPR) repeat protein
VRPRIAIAPLLAALLSAGHAPGQDFDPGGRRGKRKPAAAASPGSRRPAQPPARPGGGPGSGDDDGGARGATVEAQIARYTALLAARPHEAFPLQKLVELHRQRDGKLDALVAEFEKRAATSGPEQPNLRLALAAVYGQAGREGDAARLLEEAAAADPRAAAPRLMLAELARKRGDKAGVRAHFEAAQPLLAKGAEHERVTRELMLLAIDLKDFDAARKHHEELVRASGGSLFVRKELGSELLQRGHAELAEAEFRKLVQAAAGDNRALAPALRDLGKALAKQKKMDEALEILMRARAIAGDQAGIRAEILALLTDVFREQGRLTELVEILEREGGRDFHRLATIGQLYEETGQVDKALAAYRKALEAQGRDIDTRVKLVHLLQTAGQLDEAIREYEALIKAAPHNPDFVFELADTLIQRGDRDKALKLVGELEQRAAQEAEVLAAVADFYERIEEATRAVAVLERLSKLPSGDPQYLIDLGDRYFQQGDKKRALATWQKIRTLIQNRARAAATLGEVYLEHDLPDEALASLKEAVKLDPEDKRIRKQLATALERTAGAMHRATDRYQEALQIWQRLLAESEGDEALARECRTHIVGLWALLRQLPGQVAPLSRALEAEPPDLQAGRLLAEVLRRLNRLPDAERTLRRIVAREPADEGSLLALERVLVMQRNLTEAIRVLERLAELNPKRARQYYQRMAQYAAELYRDDDAIRYAARAVELSPDDATGHYKLGQMYRRRQDNARAAEELRRAIQKNDRLFAAYFELAELLLSTGKIDEADRLYRRVLRGSRDEEMVARAARLSMQLNLGRGSLESLERELLPVALGNPQKAVYRRLLVELYGAMTFPLVHAARLGQGEAARRARDELTRIGARAVKPLLDALGDDRVAQQRVAIEVLAYVLNKGAGPALFNYATGHAEAELRARAMVACGALGDPALLPRYTALLAPETGDAGLVPGDAVVVAAAWGVARMGGDRAETLLRRMLGAPSPDVRALAALGLGVSRNPKHAEALVELASAPEAGPTARAAAVQGLGEIGVRAHRSLLLALSDSPEVQVKTAAVAALARLDVEEGARSEGRGRTAAPATVAPTSDLAGILAHALLSEQPELRRAAVGAAAALATQSYRRPDATFAVPEGGIVVSEVLGDLAPRGYSRAEQVRAVSMLRAELGRAAAAAVATSPERARVVAELVLGKLAGLLDGAGDPLAAEDERALAEAAETIAAASVRGFVALARHPSLEARQRAVELLARRAEPEARAAVVAALEECQPDVCKAALAALGDNEDARTTQAVVALLGSARSWSIRARAAEALGRLGRVGGADDDRGIEAALARAASADSYALVREAALRAAAAHDRGAARALLERAAREDAEPRLRALAGELLRAGGGK